MALRAAMVLTTIADPVRLEGYCANFAARGYLEPVQVIVIPDKSIVPGGRAWIAACRELATA